MDHAAASTSSLFIELGCAVVGLAVLARVANRWSFSAIPLYLIAGLAFGNGGLAPVEFSRSFIQTGAEIGVLLLLFMLGLENTGEQLKQNLRDGWPAGLVDFALNFTPGLIAGLLVGWKLLPSFLLGGATYVSSSGIIARVLASMGPHPETQSVLTVLVLGDFAMAVYLPLAGALLEGGGPATIALAVAIAIVVVLVVLFIALRFGQRLSVFAAHQSDEIILLTILGTILLVGGVAESFQVSAGIGAFLVGIAVSGPIREQSHRIFAPLRDLFAAIFFFFFGLEIDPATLVGVIPFAVTLGLVTALTKVLTGYWASGKTGAGKKGRLRAGIVLISRGEFSIVIAGLGAALQPQLVPVAAAYVLFLAILGPLLARVMK
jgi:CPA2 family monovalent cation:H+ antiporter-2